MKECSKCHILCGEYVQSCPQCGSTRFEEATDSLDSCKRKHSKMGILSFILSMTGILAPLGVILAVIALVTAKKRNKKIGFPVAALAATPFTIWLSSILVILLLVTTATPSTAYTDSFYESKEYLSSCQVLDYNDVNENPDDFMGENIVIQGRVMQVNEGMWGLDSYQIQDKNNHVWHVNYHRSKEEWRVVKEETIAVYGVCNGSETYSPAGRTTLIPKITGKYRERVLYE